MVFHLDVKQLWMDENGQSTRLDNHHRERSNQEMDVDRVDDEKKKVSNLRLMRLTGYTESYIESMAW